LIFRSARKMWQPAAFQGKIGARGYFEGWYYKFADKSEQHVWALIPGISLDENGRNSHCFIQFLDGSGVLSHYFSYPVDKFSYSSYRPEIKIGDNCFSPAGIEIDIGDNTISLKGAVNFQDIKPWPVSFLSPGAMGWYAFVPFMECYHGVLSFDHLIEGQVALNSQVIDFSGGRGYIEKDWGRSFPSYHIWIQTNHFAEPDTSLMVSIANIPWLRRSFDGFLIGFWYKGRLYKFTTYTRSRIKTFDYDQEKLTLHVESKGHRLEIEVFYKKGAVLRTPVLGEMQGRLSESLTAETNVRFYEKSRSAESMVFSGRGRHTGIEIEGTIPAKLNISGR
jgi:tocopherol cyclase